MKEFYTPFEVANLLISLLNVEQQPKSAIDICCGSWNLLKASKKRWPSIRLTGIDINIDLHRHSLNKRSFHCMDGRNFALEAYKKNQRYSVVVANPPFGKESLETVTMFKELPGYLEMSSLALQRIETTMILANLALLSKNGVLGIVIPSTIVNGEWATCLRSYITKNYGIKKIIKLPSTVFGKDISTAILIIENRKSKSNFIRVYEATEQNNTTYKLDFLYKIIKSDANNGIWENSVRPFLTQNFKIKRGQIGNNFLKYSGILPVIHSTDIGKMNNPHWKPTKYLPKTNWVSNHVPYSEKGDILMIRVGRNSGCATLQTSPNKMLVSDCVYVIKSNEQRILKNIWEIVNSTEYLNDLASIRKGVTAKYITIDALKNYLNCKLVQKEENINDYYQTRSKGTC